jgi:predicted DNA-binding transcriptional regulator AlpA
MTSYQPTDKIATPLDKESSVRVFSCLLDAGMLGIRLYLFLRSRDKAGTGRLYLKVSDLCEALGVSRSTIYQWLKDKNCFYRPKYFKSGKNKGYVLVRYRALKDVCFRSGAYPTHWFELMPRELGNRMVAISTAVEAVVKTGQIQAEYALKHPPQPKDVKKRGFVNHQKYDVIPAERAVKALSKVEKGHRETARLDKSQVKGYGFTSRFRFFAISGRQRVAGVSQRWIAKKQKRSEPTACRRLSAKSRQKYGLAPLQRRRVAYEIGCDVFAARVQTYLEYELGCDYGAIEHEGRIKMVAMLDLGNGRKPYILLTNIYSTDIEVFPCKYLRFRINRFVKSGGARKSGNPLIDETSVNSVDSLGISNSPARGKENLPTGFNTDHLSDEIDLAMVSAI